MRNAFKLFYICTSFCFLTSCEKSSGVNDISGTYIVTRIFTKNEIQEEVGQNIIINNFNEIRARLEVNSCYGEYELKEANGVRIYGFGCTEACCDSESSDNMLYELVRAKEVIRLADGITMRSDSGFVDMRKVN